MALVSSSTSPPLLPLPHHPITSPTSSATPHSSLFPPRFRLLRLVSAASSPSHVCPLPPMDKSTLSIAETASEDQLWAAACLRVRSFHDFNPSSFGIQDHKRYLEEREFEALKERIAGKRAGFKRVTCINATLPLSALSSSSSSSLFDDLCAECKFTENGEDRVVVGTLDLNQCLRLPEEITGMKPQGIGADFRRAYLSSVCVAKELQRNGLGYDLVAKAKTVALEWGMSDLYVHVAVNNDPAKKLYMKSGFIYENDEPAWQARYLDRPRRLLLWIGLSVSHDL